MVILASKSSANGQLRPLPDPRPPLQICVSWSPYCKASRWDRRLSRRARRPGVARTGQPSPITLRWYDDGYGFR